MRLFDIAVTSFLYWNFTDYGRTYIDFRKSIGDKLDLSDRDHRAFLLNWLNKWGCRFDKGQFDVASRQIAAWNRRYERELPARGKGLWNYTQAEKDGIGEAYEDLRRRRASIRERNETLYDRLIGPTAASKVLFVLRPNAAVAWDEGIRKGLKDDYDPLTYREFLEKVSDDLKTLAAECADKGFTLTSLPDKLKRDRTTPAQLVGEYYWAIFTRKFSLPDTSDFKLWVTWSQP